VSNINQSIVHIIGKKVNDDRLAAICFTT